MISLDTNILLRIVISDPDAPEQNAKARNYVQGLWDKQISVLVTSVVIVESCWVIRRRYKLPKEAVIEFVEYLLALEMTELEHRSEVSLALLDYKQGKGDFSDYIIGRISESLGCNATWTFDKDLSEKGLFEIKQSA